MLKKPYTIRLINCLYLSFSFSVRYGVPVVLRLVKSYPLRPIDFPGNYIRLTSLKNPPSGCDCMDNSLPLGLGERASHHVQV